MSGVKITNERRPRATSASEDVEGVVDVDDNVDWDPTPGSSPGSSELDQWKQPVVAATTANITIATALNAGDTIDGVTLAAGNRVLVKDQSSAAQNGIYVVGSTPERAVDMDEDDEVLGAVVYVIAGTANAGTAWAVDLTAAPIVDTDPITWAAFGDGGGSALTVEEVDTSPTDAAVTKIVFPNGTLSIVGHVVTYTPAAATIAVAEDGSTVVAAATTIDGRHAIDVSAPGGGVARLAVDEGEFTYGGTGAMAAEAIGSTALAGSGALPADIGHRHAMPSAAAPSGGYGTPAAGSAATLLRSDAVFPIPGVASALNVPINGRGSVIGTGIANFAVRVKGNYTITGWAVYTDLSGAATIDIWKKAHASYPPTVSDTIIGGGGTKPNSGSARKNSGGVSGWGATTLSDGDVLIFNVDSNATNTWLTVVLDLTRTG